jgi:hypothetical protein
MDEHERERLQLLDVQSLLTLLYFLLVLVLALVAQDIGQKTQGRRSKASAWTSFTTRMRRLYGSVSRR